MDSASSAACTRCRVAAFAVTVGALIATAPGTGLAQRPILSVVETTHREPTAGGTNTVTVTISLSRSIDEQVRFSLRTEDSYVGGAGATAGGCGTSGADYQAIATTTRTIPSNATTTSIPITVCGDGIHEGNEYFRVRLVSVESGNADIFTRGYSVVTIEDADRAPSIAIASTVSVGASSPVNALTKEARFRVTLSGTSTQRSVQFNYRLLDGTGKVGTSCLDRRLGTIVTPAGAYFAASGSNLTVTPAGLDIPVTICQPASGKNFTLQLFGVQFAEPAIVDRLFTIP